MINDLNGAGESRRSRRLALNSALTLIVGALLLLAIGRGDAEKDDSSWSVADTGFQRTDAQLAEHLLESVNGANPVVCAAIDRVFNSGSWGDHITLAIDGAIPDEANETARWIGKRRINREVLPIVRRGLASADPCTRRVAARIAGYVDVPRIDEELRAELESGSQPTRVAALIALGYAERHEAQPLLRRLIRDNDRNVRYASLWALGRLENPDNVSILVPLLQNDADAEIRRLAAWALGQIDD